MSYNCIPAKRIDERQQQTQMKEVKKEKINSSKIGGMRRIDFIISFDAEFFFSFYFSSLTFSTHNDLSLSLSLAVVSVLHKSSDTMPPTAAYFSRVRACCFIMASDGLGRPCFWGAGALFFHFLQSQLIHTHSIAHTIREAFSLSLSLFPARLMLSTDKIM